MDRPGEIAQLHALIAELLNATVDEIGEIDPDEPLMNYGMDSLRVMSLVQRLDAAGLPSDFIAMMTDQTLASWESIVVGESSRNSVRQIEFAAWHGGHAERGGLAMSVETSAASRQWAPLEQPRAGFCPMPPDRAEHYVRQGLWRGLTFDDVLARVVRDHEDRVALTDGARSLNYAQLWEQIDAVAENFAASSVRPGQCVILHLPNTIEFYPLYLGLLRLGAMPLLALPGHRETELEAFARSTAAVGVVTVETWLGVAHATIARNVADRLAREGRTLELWTDPAALTSASSGQTADRSGWGVHPQDAAFLLVSGGSTGVPKLIARAIDPYLLTLELSDRICGVDDSTVFLAALPVAHNYANSSPGALGVLLAGGTVVLAPASSPDICLPLIERFGVTMVALVPPLAMIWVDALGDRPAPESLRTVQIGGAKLTVSAAERVEKAFPGRVQQVFGMAEGLVCYTRLDDDDEVRLGTQGRPMCSADELLVTDSDGCPVPQGEVGELRTRGPYTISGYYANPAATAKSIDDRGYYRTGDLVRVRPDGNLVVEGRAVQVINRAGEKILGEEVENVLLELDDVIDATVTGRPDDLTGQCIVAFLILRQGSALGEIDLRRHVQGSGLAAFKHPDRYEIVSAIPTTAVGKNDRALLSGGRAT